MKEKPGRNIIQSAAIKDIIEYGEIKKEIMEQTKYTFKVIIK